MTTTYWQTLLLFKLAGGAGGGIKEIEKRKEKKKSRRVQKGMTEVFKKKQRILHQQTEEEMSRDPETFHRLFCYNSLLSSSRKYDPLVPFKALQLLLMRDSHDVCIKKLTINAQALHDSTYAPHFLSLCNYTVS